MSIPDPPAGPPQGGSPDGPEQVSSSAHGARGHRRADARKEPGPIDSLRLATLAADLIHERQGEDIVILDVAGPLAIADYFVIATARSHRQAQALGHELIGALKAEGIHRRNAAGIDTDSGWVLLDFNDVVVHVFLAEQREFYALETLWGDAPRVAYEPAAPTADVRSTTGEDDSDWPLA